MWRMAGAGCVFVDDLRSHLGSGSHVVFYHRRDCNLRMMGVVCRVSTQGSNPFFS